MSEHNPDWIAVFSFCGGAAVGGALALGMAMSDHRLAREKWRDQLVDDPAAVAHIRSVVLAERELKKMKEGK